MLFGISFVILYSLLVELFKIQRKDPHKHGYRSGIEFFEIIRIIYKSNYFYRPISTIRPKRPRPESKKDTTNLFIVTHS